MKFNFASKEQEEFFTHNDPFFKCRSGEMANTEDLKSSEEIPLAGSSPASGKLLWCNSHQRRAERCKVEGGILLPCEVVDLTEMVEIEEKRTSSIVYLKELIRIHEALLMTLRASHHPWIEHVVRNASAHYYFWKNNMEKEIGSNKT